MMALTTIAKLLGMLRSARIAALFGIGVEAEALAAAGRLPNMLLEILPAAAISGCFLPIFGRKRTDKGGFTACFGILFLLILTMLALVCGQLTRPLTSALFPGLSPDAVALTERLLARYALTLLPMGMVALLTALCQAGEHYLLPPIVGLSANALELAVLYRSHTLSPLRVVDLRLLTLCLSCILLAYPLRVTGLPRLRAGISPLKQALARLPAAIIAALLMPLSLGAATAIASYQTGGTALLSYAVTLFSAVLGITASGVINYSFPKLTATGDAVTRMRRTAEAFVAILSISLPLSLLLCLLAPEGVSLLYHRGQLAENDALAIARVLSLLALSLPFCTAEEFFSRLALLADDKRSAVLPPLIGAMALLPLSLLLRPLGPEGGAIAFGICHLTAALLQGYCLRHQLPKHLLAPLPYFLWGLAVLCLVYELASRLLPPLCGTNPLLLSVSVALPGGFLYLIVCRFTIGRERSIPLS